MVDHRVWFLAGRAAAECGVGAHHALRRSNRPTAAVQECKRRFARYACELWSAEAVAAWWGRHPETVRRMVG